jgi:hypothetical protein
MGVYRERRGEGEEGRNEGEEGRNEAALEVCDGRFPPPWLEFTGLTLSLRRWMYRADAPP